MRALVETTERRGARIYIPAGVLAQVWRGAGRQQPIAALLAKPHVQVIALDQTVAKAAGELCGRHGTLDIVDASVAIWARQTRSVVITSDPADLRRLDPSLPIELI